MERIQPQIKYLFFLNITTAIVKTSMLSLGLQPKYPLSPEPKKIYGLCLYVCCAIFLILFIFERKP